VSELGDDLCAPEYARPLGLFFLRVVLRFFPCALRVLCGEHSFSPPLPLRLLSGLCGKALAFSSNLLVSCYTREILFPPLPYVGVYRMKEQTIEVLRIYHGAQDRT